MFHIHTLLWCRLLGGKKATSGSVQSNQHKKKTKILKFLIFNTHTHTQNLYGFSDFTRTFTTQNFLHETDGSGIYWVFSPPKIHKDFQEVYFFLIICCGLTSASNSDHAAAHSSPFPQVGWGRDSKWGNKTPNTPVDGGRTSLSTKSEKLQPSSLTSIELSSPNNHQCTWTTYN